MLGWIFGGLVKKLERAAREVSQDLLKDAGREIGCLIDEQLYPLADKLDYMAQKRIKQSISAAGEVKDEFKADIEDLLHNTDSKIKHTLDKIEQVREEAIRDLRKTIGQTDTYLENRIDQISLVVMQALKFAQDVGSEFTPEAFTKKLIEPVLVEVNILEEKLFQDANQLVDKINEDMDEKLELIRNELKKYLAHALPGPFDKCRQRLEIAWKPGAMLSDVELYELSECYEISKLNENTPIDEVTKIYGQLQLNAARMAALVKKSPELKRRAVQDWLQYGVLCKIWRDTIKSYDSRDPLILEQHKQQKFLTNQGEDQDL